MADSIRTRVSARSANLNAARREKDDEFYTLYPDIASEVQAYAGCLAGRRVYCNCDDPDRSMFVRFFDANFDAFGLAGLTATCFVRDGRGTFYERTRSGRTSSGRLSGNGDFRSPECMGFLAGCDVAVTNPPFSLFREYVKLLMEHRKKFLIIGNMNALTYKDFFPYVKDGDIWLGPSISSGDRRFWVPDDYELKAAGCGVDDTGRKYIRVKGVRWFTNLDHEKRHERLVLEKTYEPGMYELYSNYGAINVDHVKDIPDNYRGVMGVPITFLDKYCPEQFEITGFCKGFDGRDLYYIKDNKKVCPYLRILIRCRR